MDDTKEKKKNWFNSLFTDREWDSDLTKVLGFGIVVAGLIGFFMGKSDFQWVVSLGAGLIATGKFSKEG
jgi:FtsH-binding integral membrane protein